MIVKWEWVPEEDGEDRPHDTSYEYGYVGGKKLFYRSVFARLYTHNHMVLKYFKNGEEITLLNGKLEGCQCWDDLKKRSEGLLLNHHRKEIIKKVLSNQ